MKIAIASGKGGTGKTTIATNLAYSLYKQGQDVQLLDCDVEEPNCHIFVQPDITVNRTATVPVPQVDADKCTLCGTCGEVCQYSAIVCMKKKVLAFPELCHGCGGCTLFCPEGAITETGRNVGVVEMGRAKGFAFIQGRLQIGEVMAPPLISAVKEAAGDHAVTIIDAPPGTSCPVITAVKDADFVLLATEPTPFGLNDLKLAVDMVRELKIPFAIAVNRSDPEEQMINQYGREENIEIIFDLPYDRRIAEAYSVGDMVIDVLPEYKGLFVDLYENVSDRLKG